MANLQKAAIILVNIYGNGTDTTFSLDLLRDPYFITYQGGSFEELPVNWFSQNLAANPPVGVFVSPGDSASLSGYVLNYTFGTAPTAGGPHGCEIGLLF